MAPLGADISSVSDTSIATIKIELVEDLSSAGRATNFNSYNAETGELICLCEIKIKYPTSIQTYKYVLGHEIGHCLTLPHTEYPSVMNGGTVFGTEENIRIIERNLRP